MFLQRGTRRYKSCDTTGASTRLAVRQVWRFGKSGVSASLALRQVWGILDCQYPRNLAKGDRKRKPQRVKSLQPICSSQTSPFGVSQTAGPDRNRNYEPVGQEGLVIWGKFSTNNGVTDGHTPPRESSKKLHFSDALPEKNAGACVDRQPALPWKPRCSWSIASNGWSIGTVLIRTVLIGPRHLLVTISNARGIQRLRFSILTVFNTHGAEVTVHRFRPKPMKNPRSQTLAIEH